RGARTAGGACGSPSQSGPSLQGYGTGAAQTSSQTRLRSHGGRAGRPDAIPVRGGRGARPRVRVDGGPSGRSDRPRDAASRSRATRDAAPAPARGAAAVTTAGTAPAADPGYRGADRLRGFRWARPRATAG